MATLDLCTSRVDADVHSRAGDGLKAGSTIWGLFETEVCTNVSISLMRKPCIDEDVDQLHVRR